MDCNKLKEKLQKQNKSNTELKLELEVTRVQFEDASNYFKKKSYRVKQLETVIDQLKVAKTKTNIIFPLVKIPIATFQYFVYALFLSFNKSQLALSMQQDLSKTFYNDWRRSISTAIKFNLKKIIS